MKGPSSVNLPTAGSRKGTGNARAAFDDSGDVSREIKGELTAAGYGRRRTAAICRSRSGRRTGCLFSPSDVKVFRMQRKKRSERR
jgi:hypothetical protein